MIVFSISTIYSIVKKYVAVNNKENTSNISLLNMFLYTKSDFIVIDFTMKSLPIIGSYFRWRMLGDSLTFQLSSLAPLKGGKKRKLRPPKKGPISKMSINDFTSINFKSSMYVMKIVKTKIRKQKLWFLLYVPPLLKFLL